MRIAANGLQTIIKRNNDRTRRKVRAIIEVAFQLIHRQRGIAHIAQPGHLVTERAH